MPDDQPPQPAPGRTPDPKGDEHHSHRALAGAVRAVSGVTLLSRLGGLVRDVLLGRIFGNTAMGSAFAAAFAIPNMFRRLFGEGALSAAFIPEYTDALKDDPARADELASLTVRILGAVAGGLTVVIELVLLALLLTLPRDADRELSLRLIMVMLPFMPMICIVAVLAGMLQVHGRFAASSSGPLLLNGFIIAVGLYHELFATHATEGTAYALAIATLLSGFTQAFWFARLLRPHVRWTRVFAHVRDRASRMLHRFIPVMIGMGTLQLNAFLDTLVAMWPIWVGPTLLGYAYPLDDGSNIILSLTTRLYQFPLGVFGIAVATATFPLLARHTDRPDLFISTLRRGLRLSMFIGLPASIGLVLVRSDLTRVLFSGGTSGFDEQGLARSAAVLAGFAPGVWAYSINHVLTRAFYARGDTRTPMRIAIAMVGVNLALNCTLIWFLREAGLAWATSTSAVVQCAVLAIVCSRTLKIRILDRDTAVAFARLVVAGLLMGLAVWLAITFIPSPPGWRGSMVRLVEACLVGVGAYAALTSILRGPELAWLLKRS
ncbi:MAG: murein biosynthesis integral membrane protein MurJ [Phycisphaeraceae bacterium]|nr:murein biosynthesis integral membrane protein MurJ [Phycisphaeraceae bacterium]